MCINVGGKKHWIMARNFVNFPGTRLGKLARAKNKEEILELCDKYWPGDEISGKSEYSVLSSCRVGPRMSEKFWGVGDWAILPLSLLFIINTTKP